MTRNDYLRELDRYLKKLPQDDYQEAMEYFTEYFDEAGPEKEAEVIRELGSPREAANEILHNILDEKTEHNNLSPKNNATLIWIAILAILASPLAFPLAITALALVLTFVILGFSVILVFFSLALAGFLSGIAFLIDGFTYLPTSLPASCLGWGLGLLALGIAALTVLAGTELSRALGRGITSLVRWVGKRGGRQ
ncbi:DUF1700 domain-containing protein [Streptococcus dentasini]